MSYSIDITSDKSIIIYLKIYNSFRILIKNLINNNINFENLIQYLKNKYSKSIETSIYLKMRKTTTENRI